MCIRDSRWAASVIFWSGSVSFRIRKEVSTLAQSSMTCLLYTSVAAVSWPEQVFRYPQP